MGEFSKLDPALESSSKITPFWIKLLPAPLRARIEQSSNLQRILANSGWLFIDRIFRLGLGLLLGVWIARYLGPSQFGTLNYSISIVAIFMSIAGLGLNGIVIRDLVRNQANANVTLGTSFLLQFFAGILSFILVVVAINILRPTDSLVKFIVVILGLAILLKATEIVKFWFESEVKSKYIVFLENGIFFIFVIVKLLLIFNNAPILAFVWTILAEAIFLAASLLILYTKFVGSLWLWRPSLTRAKQLTRESWPLILVTTSSMMSMRLDQLMLGAMVSDMEVGYFAAAARLGEVWLVIPGIIGASIYPSLIKSREINLELYRRRVLQIIKIMAIIILPLAIIISLLSNNIILWTYGESFMPAGKILAIYIWSGVPYIIFFVLSQMVFIEGLLKTVFWMSIVVVITTIVLNLLLIPQFGGIGAAVATLLTSLVSIFISLGIINHKTGIFWKKNL